MKRSRYRILKVTRHPYWRSNEVYLVQKRVWGFLWWTYIDEGHPYGHYATYKEAEQRLEAEMTADKYEVMREC